jgi:predicted Zn-dependent protease
MRISRTLRSLACRAVAALLASALATGASQAQAPSGRSLPIIRDAEIEGLMREYAAPIFRAAGIDARAARIILVNDRSFNAFVANGRKIFLNVGVLMDAETPNEVIGVLAHEAGHIAGGHLARLRAELANAQILSVVGMLAGAAAVAGGAASGGRVGSGAAGAMGALTGPQELVRRNLLSYQRSEEQAADQAAVRYLTSTGQSPRGMITTFRRFAESGLFRSSSVDPYLLSHPLPSERIAQLETLAKASPHYGAKDPPALQARHDLMRAKLFGFIERPDAVLRRYPPTAGTAPARYARAIVAHRSGRLAEAQRLMGELTQAQPENAYFHELHGQILLESGRAREALGPLRRAAAQAPNAPTIKTMLGQALVAQGDPGSIDEAIRHLSNAAQRDPDSPEPFRHLAQAYGRKGDIGMAEVSSAQAAMNTGDLKYAQTLAYRAMTKLKPGSPGYLRADDIVNFRPPSSR